MDARGVPKMNAFPYDVSVLIATHNGALTIGRAIQSAFNNTVKVQVVVCDDCSNDDTLRVVKTTSPSYQEQIKLVRHAQNKGTAQALNSAAQAALGRYFIILGDDDYLQRGALDALHTALKNRHDVGFAYGATHYFGASERIHQPDPYYEPDFWKTFPSLYAVLYDRAAYDGGCTYRDLITLENGRGLGACDYDFVLQMITHGYTGLALRDVLVLHYLYNPHKRQSALVNERQKELVARFKETWSKWEGNAL
jgi:glycosyltransferase involved in cell wall biosynthesis